MVRREGVSVGWDLMRERVFWVCCLALVWGWGLVWVVDGDSEGVGGFEVGLMGCWRFGSLIKVVMLNRALRAVFGYS